MLAAVATLAPGRGDGAAVDEAEGGAEGVAEDGLGGGEKVRGAPVWCADAKGSVCRARLACPAQQHSGILFTVVVLVVPLGACCCKVGGGARLSAKS